MLSNIGNETALVIESTVPLIHNLLKTETEKITNYQNLALEIKNICKVNNVSIHTFVISMERVITINFLKYLENIGLTKNVLRVGQNQVTLQTKSSPVTGLEWVRFPDFMTTAQEGGKVVSLTQRPHLPPGYSPATNFC